MVLSEVFVSRRNMKIDPSHCGRKPQAFGDALVDAFQQMGALLIETRILARFYKSIGARYSRSDDLNFAGEIRRARIEFERIAAEKPPQG